MQHFNACNLAHKGIAVKEKHVKTKMAMGNKTMKYII